MLAVRRRGLTALGANFVNMGLIGAVGGYAIYAPLRRCDRRAEGRLDRRDGGRLVLGAAGVRGVRDRAGASGAAADFFQILTWMALVHAAIGVGEASITGLVVRFLLYRRADLFEVSEEAGRSESAAGRWGQTLLGGLGVALAVAVFLAPFAYDQPDGLEFVGGKLGFLADYPPRPPMTAPIADYQLVPA